MRQYPFAIVDHRRMQERVPVVRRDPPASDGKPVEKKKGKPRKAAPRGAREPKQALPPRFRGTPVPFAIQISRIWVADVVPGLPRPFSGVCDLKCDLVITVAGRRAPGLSIDEFAESGDVTLNEWLRKLSEVRLYLRLEKKFVCRATGNQLGLVFERKGTRVAFSVHDTYAKAAVPGFGPLVLDHDALLNELRAFVAQVKRLVLETAPNHATADSWWHWNLARSIDAPDTDD